MLPQHTSNPPHSQSDKLFLNTRAIRLSVRHSQSFQLSSSSQTNSLQNKHCQIISRMITNPIEVTHDVEKWEYLNERVIAEGLINRLISDDFLKCKIIIQSEFEKRRNSKQDVRRSNRNKSYHKRLRNKRSIALVPLSCESSIRHVCR